jgi:hypothetical protein
VFQYALDDTGIVDDGNHPHRPPALRTFERIDFIDLLDQARPGCFGAIGNLRLSLVLRHGRVRVVGCPLTANPVGVPADVAHEVLIAIGDVAAQQLQPWRARHQLKRVALDQRIRLLGVRAG